MAFLISRRNLLASASRIAAGVAVGAVAKVLNGADEVLAAESDLIVIPTKVYPTPDAPDGMFPLKYRKLLAPTAPRARYLGFNPGKWTLKAGTIRREGAKPLPVDIVFERDVGMQLRDGTTIYTDIFRPVGDQKVPAIFSWSPYGKELGGQWLDDLPGRQGVPLSLVSELQRFEGADPAYWCQHGYAVVNPDPRGALMSQGNVNYWGRQLAEDGYDFIEWIAEQPWCSGKVVMSGNSWLAVSQWFTAAERPPHLVAIAPWEGLVEQSPAPGIPVPMVFGEIIAQSLAGNGYIEDQSRNLLDNPTMNGYWHDRRAKVERIEVPAYIVASYTNMAHTVGTFDSWRHIGTPNKWLRIHNTQEWTDYYDPANVEDLRRFFDHYTKDIDNGWPTTPLIRMAVLDPGGVDIVNRAESSFPPDRAVQKKAFLQRDHLAFQPIDSESSISYDADGGITKFVLEFERETEISGYMTLRLWVEAQGSDDMDIAVSVRKRPSLVKRLKELLPGPPESYSSSGLLRVSYREIDPERSTEINPVLAMRRELRLAPNEVVQIAIALSPMAMIFHKGEELELSISGFRFPPFIPLAFGEAKIPFPIDGLTFSPAHPTEIKNFFGAKEDRATKLAPPVPPTRNRGNHILHVGGRYESHLSFFEVPQE